MIRSLYFASDESFQTDLAVTDFPRALADENGILWVDFQDEPNENSEPILREVFGFHPLAIDDALKEEHVPKVDDWESYIYVVLHAVSAKNSVTKKLSSGELDVFLGSNYIVTHHDEPVEALDRVWKNSPHDYRHYKMGADHLLYRLTDELVVDYMNVIESFDQAIDKLEDQVFINPNPKLLQRIFSLKRSAVLLRRTLSPQREVLNRLARDDFQVIDQRDQVYFRDVYDHLVRLHDITEGLRDVMGGVLDTYLSVINNRMNDVMKTLTVITTLFMPLSFLAGFFGMNFFAPDPYIPYREVFRQLAFQLMMLVMVVTPVIMIAWMRRRRWM